MPNSSPAEQTCRLYIISPDSIPDVPAFAKILEETLAAGDVACFTNKNGLIDMMAPGLSLTGGGYSLSGTSMAAPIVAGTAALIWSMSTLK